MGKVDVLISMKIVVVKAIQLESSIFNNSWVSLQNCCLVKELGNERSSLFQKEMKITKRNQTIHEQQQQLEEVKHEVAWIEYQNNVEVR